MRSVQQVLKFKFSTLGVVLDIMFRKVRNSLSSLNVPTHHKAYCYSFFSYLKYGLFRIGLQNTNQDILYTYNVVQKVCEPLK